MELFLRFICVSMISGKLVSTRHMNPPTKMQPSHEVAFLLLGSWQKNSEINRS